MSHLTIKFNSIKFNSLGWLYDALPLRLLQVKITVQGTLGVRCSYCLHSTPVTVAAAYPQSTLNGRCILKVPSMVLAVTSAVLRHMRPYYSRLQESGCVHICDPTQANEALWGRYQNWHFKFNILFNVQGTFWHQNDFHIIFLSKVINNLISNCLITLKINYWDMGRQNYWFVHKPI